MSKIDLPRVLARGAIMNSQWPVWQCKRAKHQIEQICYPFTTETCNLTLMSHVTPGRENGSLGPVYTLWLKGLFSCIAKMWGVHSSFVIHSTLYNSEVKSEWGVRMILYFAMLWNRNLTGLCYQTNGTFFPYIAETKTAMMQDTPSTFMDCAAIFKSGNTKSGIYTLTLPNTTVEVKVRYIPLHSVAVKQKPHM